MSKSVTKRLARNFDDALDDVQRQLRKIGEGVSDESKEAVIEAAEKLRRAAESFVGDTRRETRQLARRAVKEVRRHPIEATAIAAGVAALVGLLMARGFHHLD